MTFLQKLNKSDLTMPELMGVIAAITFVDVQNAKMKEQCGRMACDALATIKAELAAYQPGSNGI